MRSLLNRVSLIFITCIFLANICIGMSYAQKQDIAESFGLCSKGIDAYCDGNLYEAKNILEQAVKLDPRNNEAQGYLDLVNAEIKMRSEGKLDFHNRGSDLVRERDLLNGEEKKDIVVEEALYEGEAECYDDFDETGYTGEYEDVEEEEDFGISQEDDLEDMYYDGYEPETRASRRHQGQKKISGELQLALGLTSQDVIWKDANGDKVGVPFEKNWRYLWGDERYNTYDKKIYDRLKIDIDTKKQTGFNLYSQVVIDPWTFIGTKDVSITNAGAADDRLDLTLKYWSNTGSTVNETYRTDQGHIVTIREGKVIEGETSETRPLCLNSQSRIYNVIPGGLDIEEGYMPIRKFWVDYNTEDKSFNSRLFLIADQYQALTSDDPLRLSNNHVYWEESPWLDQYEPSRIFNRPWTDSPVKEGKWVRSQSYFTKDTDYNRLTFLRGLSLNGFLSDSTSYKMTLATPMTLWDDYENSNSIPAAIRLMSTVSSKLTVGSIYTFKGGMNSGTLEAMNQALGFDGIYKLTNSWDVFGEVAVSSMDVEEANGMQRNYGGYAYSTGLKSKPFNTEFKIAYMDKDFFPALSNYRYTRRDEFYSKHVRFSKMPDQDEKIALGDGMDRGRLAFGVENSKDFFNNSLKARFNMRNVRKDDGKQVETVSRLETTYNVDPKTTLKGLAYYQHLPNTVKGYDPLIYAKTSYGLTDYFSEEDVFMKNSAVADGEDPSIGSFGLGVRRELTDNLAWEGVYERTNDPGDTPRGILNGQSYTTEVRDGIIFDKIVPYLYSQGFFELPPYDYYDIYKTKFIYKPFTKLTGILSYTRNINKQTIGIDDNVNHVGLEFDYKHNKKLTFGFKYIYSRMIDVYRQVKGEGVNYDGHHNIFAGLDYNIDNDQKLSILFGEFVGYAPLDDMYALPKWSLSSLDTQHIVRMFYNRTF
ncbi:MAG: hypothetical protein ABIG92_02595 [Candidatus Omnitrophota bacterium]